MEFGDKVGKAYTVKTVLCDLPREHNHSNQVHVYCKSWNILVFIHSFEQKNVSFSHLHNRYFRLYHCKNKLHFAEMMSRKYLLCK
jgi:hypothetical protein